MKRILYHFALTTSLMMSALFKAGVSSAVTNIAVQYGNSKQQFLSSDLGGITEKIVIAHEKANANFGQRHSDGGASQGFLIKYFLRKNRTFWVNSKGDHEFKSLFFLKKSVESKTPRFSTDVSQCSDVLPISFQVMDSFDTKSSPIEAIFLCQYPSGSLAILMELKETTSIQDAWVIDHQLDSLGQLLKSNLVTLPFIHPYLLGLERVLSDLWNSWTGKRPILNIVKEMSLSKNLKSPAAQMILGAAAEKSYNARETLLRNTPFSFLSYGDEKWLKVQGQDFFRHFGTIEGTIDETPEASIVLTMKSNREYRPLHLKLDLLNTRDFYTKHNSGKIAAPDYIPVLADTAGNLELFGDSID